MAAGPGEARDSPRRRADAERSIAAILDAALVVLAADPHASMTAVARDAGVARATIYMHFPTREALIEAVTRRAVDEVTRQMAAQSPELGAADDAMIRVLTAGWRALDRFHVLVALNSQLPPHELDARLGPVAALITPLIARGQASGVFRSDVPPSWHHAVLVALVHAASAELRAGRLSESEVSDTVTRTVLAALAG